MGPHPQAILAAAPGNQLAHGACPASRRGAVPRPASRRGAAPPCPPAPCHPCSLTGGECTGQGTAHPRTPPYLQHRLPCDEGKCKLAVAARVPDDDALPEAVGRLVIGRHCRADLWRDKGCTPAAPSGWQRCNDGSVKALQLSKVRYPTASAALAGPVLLGACRPSSTPHGRPPAWPPSRCAAPVAPA